MHCSITELRYDVFSLYNRKPSGPSAIIISLISTQQLMSRTHLSNHQMGTELVMRLMI